MKNWNAEHCSDEIRLEKFPMHACLCCPFYFICGAHYYLRHRQCTLVVSQGRGLHALSHGILAEGAGLWWSILLIVSGAVLVL